MNLFKVLIFAVSILLVSVGADKFLHFIEPPCSLMDRIDPFIWQAIGILQILGGILILNSKYRKPVSGFFLIFKASFSIVHLTQNTYDVGGSVMMAILLGLIFWHPTFLDFPHKR